MMPPIPEPLPSTTPTRPLRPRPSNPSPRPLPNLAGWLILLALGAAVSCSPTMEPLPLSYQRACWDVARNEFWPAPCDLAAPADLKPCDGGCPDGGPR